MVISGGTRLPKDGLLKGPEREGTTAVTRAREGIPHLAYLRV